MSEQKDDGLRGAIERASARRAGGERQGAEETMEVVSFRLADESYGFRLSDLVEIIGGVDPTPIPFTPAFIPGVINHRGSLVSVVDLRKVFNLPGRFRKGAGRVVLVGFGGAVVGFLADGISDIVRVKLSDVEAPLSTIERVKAEYMEGCVRQGGGLLVLLSAEALITGLRTAVLEG